MSQYQHLKDWLKKHPLINIAALEKKCRVPNTVINKLMTGNRDSFHERHLPKVYKVLKEYGYEHN